MNVLFYLIVVFITIGFHTSIADYFVDWIYARPDAVLLLIVFLGLRRRKETGLAGGFCLGLFQDVLSGGLLGLNALVKGLVGHYAGGLKNRMTTHVVLFPCMVVFAASVFDVFSRAVLMKIFLPDQPLPASYWIEGAKTIGVNFVLTPPAMALLEKIEARMLGNAAGAPYLERP